MAGRRRPRCWGSVMAFANAAAIADSAHSWMSRVIGRLSFANNQLTELKSEWQSCPENGRFGCFVSEAVAMVLAVSDLFKPHSGHMNSPSICGVCIVEVHSSYARTNVNFDIGELLRLFHCGYQVACGAKSSHRVSRAKRNCTFVLISILNVTKACDVRTIDVFVDVSIKIVNFHEFHWRIFLEISNLAL